MDLILKGVDVFMFQGGAAAILCLMLSVSACNGYSARDGAGEALVERGRMRAISDYCWGKEHFAKVDFDRADLVQVVNDDMVIYRLKGSELLYCAHPVNGAVFKDLARKRGVTVLEYRSVIP